MKNITRNDLSKFFAADSIATGDKFVALGDDSAVWGSGVTESAAELSALTELRPIVEEQVGRSVTDERAMRGVEVFAIVD
jgi:hypothetical protein